MSPAVCSRGQYSDEYKKTFGVDFLEKVQPVPNLKQDVKIMLWDTAGQEVFDSITRSYYRGRVSRVYFYATEAAVPMSTASLDPGSCLGL